MARLQWGVILGVSIAGRLVWPVWSRFTMTALTYAVLIPIFGQETVQQEAPGWQIASVACHWSYALLLGYATAQWAKAREVLHGLLAGCLYLVPIFVAPVIWGEPTFTGFDYFVNITDVAMVVAGAWLVSAARNRKRRA